MFYSLKRKPLWLVITLKEFKEILRNPVMLLLSFGVPVVFFFILGFGINLDVNNIPIAIVDYDNSKLSRNLGDGIYNNRYFTLLGYLPYEEVERLFKTNKLRAIVIIPKNFSRKIYANRSSEIQVLVDGTYPFRADIIRGYISGIVGKFNESLIKNWMKKKGIDVEITPVKLQIRSFYNQAMESKYSLIPGLFVIVLFINLTVLASLAIVREKDYGTIVNIYNTTIGRFSFVWGKIAPYILVGIINLLTLFVLSFWVFKLPFRGDPLTFFFISLFYIISACLLGAIISSFTKTMIAAQFVAMIVTIIPSFLYSGYLMPVSSLGKAGRIEAHLFPAMYYMNVCRGSYLKSMNLSRFKYELMVLFLYVILMFLAASLLFKKREQ